MDALIRGVVLLAIVPTCLPLSIDRLLLKGLETEVTNRQLQPQRWNDYKVPGFNGSYVKLQIDMIMSLEEAEKAYPNRNFRERKKRSAVRDKSKLWRERRVPFHISDDYNATQRLIIRDALQHWQQYTCLDFVPKLDTDHAYLKFENDQNGRCETFVGFQNLPQPVFLSDNCLHREVVIHEIGHAIGLYHEHARPDRDEFVKINFNNILSPDLYVNFDKGDWSVYSNYSKPYDYLSIMHYGKYYFSKDKDAGLMTIEPNDASYTDIIGNAKTISFLDAQIINTMYECSKGCEGKRCPPEGFLGRNCECYCPAPDEDVPMKLCEEQTFCTKPNVEQTIFLLFDPFDKELENLNKHFLEGAIILVVYQDDSKCGFGEGQLTCRKGQWVGELPGCVPPPPCNIPEQWQSADGNIVEDGQLMHDTEISISCPKMKSADLAYCDNGTLYYYDNDKVVDVMNPCCKLTFYRVINDEGRPCVVMYDSYVQYSITKGGERLLQGDHVGHLEKVEAACDIPDGNAVLNEEETMTIMTCIDGQWDNSPPANCPTVRRPCSVVTNAIVWERVRNGGYDVQCIPGHDLNIAPRSHFTCTFDGKWMPQSPFCIPRSCIVPLEYRVKLSTDNYINVIGGMGVKHADSVTLHCEWGEITSLTRVSCHLGEWQTPTKSLPVCKKVVCPTSVNHPVNGINYQRRNEYVFGDTINLDKCRGNRILHGPKTLTCQSDGTWSGNTTCRPNCDPSAFRNLPAQGMHRKIWEYLRKQMCQNE